MESGRVRITQEEESERVRREHRISISKGPQQEQKKEHELRVSLRRTTPPHSHTPFPHPLSPFGCLSIGLPKRLRIYPIYTQSILYLGKRIYLTGV